jgi:hypothetical protein
MVTLTNSSLNKEGQAFISVGRNRLKQYDKNTVYLENGKEFELELFNPKTTKILVKIKINGNYISSSGVVLKPGQRVFLERYLDEAKKFKFETYSIENSKEAIEATAKNGLVEIEFYDEYVAPQPYIYLNGFNSYGSITTGGPWTTNINTTNVNCSYTSNSSTLNTASMDSMNLCDTGESLRSFAPKPKHLKKSVSSTKSVETGRVEKGSTSNQSFIYDSSTYNSWTSNVVTWKILPTSQKPYEAEELVKKYCTSCGSRIKKSSWKFCPSCGGKLD